MLLYICYKDAFSYMTCNINYMIPWHKNMAHQSICNALRMINIKMSGIVRKSVYQVFDLVWHKPSRAATEDFYFANAINMFSYDAAQVQDGQPQNMAQPNTSIQSLFSNG